MKLKSLLTVETIKQALSPLFYKYGVRKAAIFGSVARGEATESSDIDLLVEFEENRSLLDLIGLKQDAEELLGVEVDVVTYNSLHPLLEDQILTSQVVIYEKGCQGVS